MNASRAQTDTLITGLRNAGELTCDLAVFPPFPYLSQAISIAEGSQISVGAQNCAEASCLRTYSALLQKVLYC